jgi:hypothetical protein
MGARWRIKSYDMRLKKYTGTIIKIRMDKEWSIAKLRA